MRSAVPLLLAILLSAAGQVEVWAIGSWRGPEPVDAVVASAPLGLAAVRRAPVAVALGLMAAYGADTVAFGAPNSITQFFALTASVFWVAGLAGTPGRIAVAVAITTGLGITQLRDPDDLTLPDRVFPFVFFGLAWTVGHMLRGRQRLADSLAERARRLEAEREALARAAVLDERVRIARELHDVVAHGVSVIVVQAVAAQKWLRTDPDRTERSLQAIHDTGQQALAEMRRLLGVLRRVDEDPLLVPQPGLDQLDRLVDGAREAGLEVDLRVEGKPRRLPRGVDLSAYRIVQEALTNVIKHAGGGPATVRLRYGERDVELSVEDAGRGGGSVNGTGHGLVGMRERAALYGGRLEAGPRPDGGFAVRATLPA